MQKESHHALLKDSLPEFLKISSVEPLLKFQEALLSRYCGRNSEELPGEISLNQIRRKVYWDEGISGGNLEGNSAWIPAGFTAGIAASITGSNNENIFGGIFAGFHGWIAEKISVHIRAKIFNP